MEDVMASRKFFLFIVAALCCLFLFAQQQPTQSLPAADKTIASNAQRMVEQGRQIFRFDTFGSQAFWGDGLQLHKAIAGDKQGGLGPGVSPKTALAVGLKMWTPFRQTSSPP